jgi:SAM-dependent methyltransferase
VAIKYINENYLNFETEDRFDLITMIMCDYTALSPSQRQGLLGKFGTLLKTGGAVLLDVYSLEYFRKKTETAVYEFNLMDNFWDSNDYYGFLNTFKYENEKVLLDKYTICSPTDKREIYNWSQCYSEGSLSQEFGEYGFIINDFYGDVAGKEYDREGDEFAVVARKRI